jgi:hypothetical protein
MKKWQRAGVRQHVMARDDGRRRGRMEGGRRREEPRQDGLPGRSVTLFFIIYVSTYSYTYEVTYS